MAFVFPELIRKNERLEELDVSSLGYWHDNIHILWDKVRDGYDVRDWNLSELYNAHKKIIELMKQKGIVHLAPINNLDEIHEEKPVKDQVKQSDQKTNKNINIVINTDEMTLSLSEDNEKYSIEEKLNGFHVSIHKKGNEVKIFSEQKKDITVAFPTLVNEIKKISSMDFIVDGEIVPYDEKGNILGRNFLMKFIGAVKSGKEVDDRNIRTHIWDVIYYHGNILTNLPLKERIKHLEKLKFSDRVIQVKRKLVSGIDNIKKAIKWASDIKGSEGALVKDTREVYHFGENSSWRKFRKLTPINVIVLKKVPKERGLFNYLVGAKADKKYLDPNYIKNDYLVLGHTFNTKEEFNEGDTIEILIEEVWRHETKRGIHYSIHKPRVSKKTSESVSGVDYLEDIVTSIGVVVSHSLVDGNEVLISEELVDKVSKGEGKEIEIKNFPDRLQENFRSVIGKWNDYVIHVHTRGQSLHYDIRHKTDSLLEGITLFGRSIKDRLPIETQRNDIRSTLKLPQPISWLTFEGITKKSGIGATKYHEGLFVIISKGKYTIHEITDHKVVIEYKSDKGDINRNVWQEAEKKEIPVPKDMPDNLIDMSGKYSWHIAHLPDHYIILFDRLKD